MKLTVGIIGTGAMGAGIAQVAASNGCKVLMYDTSKEMLTKAVDNIGSSLQKLLEKNKLKVEEKNTIFNHISVHSQMHDLAACDLIIEAIVEDLTIKKGVFSSLEEIVRPDCILASNTSSLSIASIAAACKQKERVIGIHFFNPAVLMPLVEIIPSLTTSEEVFNRSYAIIKDWGKVTVKAKDTPGFIVNRLARPFYGEAIKIYEEGMADFATIDYAMKSLGEFKMGPFELMDFIGNDVNYRVTETVWQQFFYDPRYRPTLTQKRLFEAGLFGRKTNKGYYDYNTAEMPQPNTSPELLQKIFLRIIAMLINEAAEALFLQIGTREDLDLAMEKGVNYKKGLLKWADEIGLEIILNELNSLHHWFGDDRYRASVLLKQKIKEGSRFY
ncbi:MAG: 3-hydroxyacyl-CoA dehydrogenase NAD-binding domain-containing protein [Bacteroidota bacterium]|jgi:3-hydroxybutyryl-CoA dehydrogenase